MGSPDKEIQAVTPEIKGPEGASISELYPLQHEIFAGPRVEFTHQSRMILQWTDTTLRLMETEENAELIAIGIGNKQRIENWLQDDEFPEIHKIAIHWVLRELRLGVPYDQVRQQINDMEAALEGSF